MKKLIIALVLLPLCFFGQKDSTMKMYMSGNGPHNGVCCGPWKDSLVYVWSYKRQSWSMLSDRVYDVYYGRIDSIRRMDSITIAVKKKKRKS